MKKINIPSYKCAIGDILAANVSDSRGMLLVAENTIVNEFIRKRLIEAGINNIWIYPAHGVEDRDWETKDYEKIHQDYEHSVVMLKNLIHDLVSDKKLDCQSLNYISSMIYEKIDHGDDIVNYLANLKDTDEYTYTHCVNTAFYCMLIAKWLGLPEPEVKKAIQSGLLHDIGKIKIPTEILNKPGKLTQQEFEEIKKHTIYGYDIVHDIEGIDIEVKRAVLMHHERIDCSGYPLNAQGEYIGLHAKIVAVADVYDAMTSNRIYKKKSSPFDAFEMFNSVGIGIFDTMILTTFLRSISSYFIGTKVMLDNGDIGQIVYIPPHNILTPVISVGSDYYDYSRGNCPKVLSII